MASNTHNTSDTPNTSDTSNTFDASNTSNTDTITDLVNPNARNPFYPVENVEPFATGKARPAPRWVSSHAVVIRSELKKLADERTNAFAVYCLDTNPQKRAVAGEAIVSLSKEMLSLIIQLGRAPMVLGGYEDGVAPPTCDKNWVKQQIETYALYLSLSALKSANTSVLSNRAVDFMDVEI